MGWHDGSALWKVTWPRPVVLGCALDLLPLDDRESDGQRCARMFYSMDGRWWSGDGGSDGAATAVSDGRTEADAEPVFVVQLSSDEDVQTRAFYPAATGVLAGRFRFKEADCRFSPPDSSYMYLC